MLQPLRNTHMTTATYYACIVYVRRYAAADLSEPMTFDQRSGRENLSSGIDVFLLYCSGSSPHQVAESTCAAAKLRSYFKRL